jgi:hypothetical protein
VRAFASKDVDPGDTLGYGSEDKPRSKEALATGIILSSAALTNDQEAARVWSGTHLYGRDHDRSEG